MALDPSRISKASRRRLGRIVRAVRRRLGPGADQKGVAEAGTPEPAAPADPALRRVLDSGVFDAEWYGAQAGTTFADPADAARHYLAQGRRKGWWPHPLFVPARYRPKAWQRDDTDPLVIYLKGVGDSWKASPSPLFDPGRLDRPAADGRSPLAAFLADDADAPLPLAPDARWMRDGVTLADVREALRAELSHQADHADQADAAAPWRESPAVRTVPGLTSLVVVDCDTTADVLTVLTAIDRAVPADDTAAAPSAEILLVTGDRRRAVAGLALARLARFDVRVVLSGQGASSAVDEAVHGARGEHVLLLSGRQAFREGTLQDLRAVLTESGAAVVHPVVLGGELLLRDVGVVYPPRGTDPVPFLDGVHPDSVPWTRPWFEVPGAPVPLLARTESVRAVRDEPRVRTLWADVDLAQRLARHEERPVVVARDVVVTRSGDGTFDDTAEPEDDLAVFRAAWQTVPEGSADLFATFGVAPVFTGTAALTAPGRPGTWTRALWPSVPDTARVREAPPALRWAIKTAMPAGDQARQWGDFHFAHSLAAALRDLGQHVVVDYAPNDARATSYRDDVVLMLRGLHPARLPGDVTSVVWVISHPEDVAARELAGYDLRFAASLTWARDVSQRWELPVAPLLQCTDPSRFYIDDEPVEDVVGKAVLVGNTRGKARPVAVEAVRSGVPVAVYGSGWQRFLPPEAIAGAYVPNEVLRRYYRSAAWALNDHWPDMRDLGFVSNRVFDVLASGGRLLTDDVYGLDEIVRPVLPEGRLARFTTPEELHALLAEGSAARYDEEMLRSLSEHVRTEHGFGARAAVLLEAVLAHRADNTSGT
ncbi:glycosyltransferase family protein [Promicromonospora sp. MS192]|uniref:glycosyltransferase family protein n=1 Tax=Promicromonospora sp. MS192 TaxID=3412684 RepID=UPI003C2BEEBA